MWKQPGGPFRAREIETTTWGNIALHYALCTMRCTTHYAVKAENVGMCKQVRIRCGCSSLMPGTGISIVPRMCRNAWSRSWRSWKVHKVRRKKKLDRGRGSWRKFSVKCRRQIRLQCSSSRESKHQLGRHADCSGKNTWNQIGNECWRARKLYVYESYCQPRRL